MYRLVNEELGFKMSRIGKQPVEVPSGVKVAILDHSVRVEGPMGKLDLDLDPTISVKHEGSSVVLERPNDDRKSKALHGLYRSLIQNMVMGVTTGYTKTLEIQGVGYKAEMKGKQIVLSVGYANQIPVAIPEGVDVKLEGPTKVVVSGVDKQKVGQFAANVRNVRKPEPYKGKGIRYQGEQVKIKAGKAFAGAGSK